MRACGLYGRYGLYGLYGYCPYGLWGQNVWVLKRVGLHSFWIQLTDTDIQPIFPHAPEHFLGSQERLIFKSDRLIFCALQTAT